MDYVKNATAYYGTVFKTRGIGLSKLNKSDNKRQDEDVSSQQNINHTSGSNLIFLNNRMTHTNKLNGYRRQSVPLVETDATQTFQTPQNNKVNV